MLAIVLSRRDFRECDQIISLYTEEKGKLDLIARGVKKITAKNAAHLEPFSFVHIDIAHGKEIDYLTTVQPIDIFSSIRQDLRKSMMAGFVVFILDRLLQTGEPDKKIFELLKTWLKFLDKNKIVVHLFVDAFVIKLLAHLGLLPILHQCVSCEKTFKQIVKDQLSGAEQGTMGFYFLGGGLVCPNCYREKKKIEEEVLPCGLQEISNLSLLLSRDWRAINGFRTSKDDVVKVHNIIYEFVVYHSEKKLPDWLKLA